MHWAAAERPAKKPRGPTRGPRARRNETRALRPAAALDSALDLAPKTPPPPQRATAPTPRSGPGLGILRLERRDELRRARSRPARKQRSTAAADQRPLPPVRRGARCRDRGFTRRRVPGSREFR